MKVLLTGANGFVGSHLLDRLRADGIPTVLLLRRRSNTRFIAQHLPHVEVHHGGLDDLPTLRKAVAGATHVLHCAGATKALRAGDLFAANQAGTRNLVQAVNETAESTTPVQRLVHLSSLAAGRAGTRAAPACEDDPSEPLSEYGRSKRAGEREVIAGCRREFVVLRPCAVYGPRDAEFLRLFKAARAHVLPVFGGGLQELSLVFAPDLAAAAVRALTGPGIAGRLLNVAGAEVVTAGELAAAIARALGGRMFRLSLPAGVLKLVCALASAGARLTGKATVLAHGKYRELTAPGWVCDTTRLQSAMGPLCQTRLADGLSATLAWYREHGWL